jgi:ABC-type sugar transport system permease subunit
MGAITKKQTKAQHRADLWRLIKKNWHAYLFISPFYILFLVFGLFSFVFSIYVSFHRWDGLTPMRWWGMGNYVELFHDPYFFQTVKNTLVLLLFDFPLKVFTPLVLAVALNSALIKKGRGVYRTLFYLPEVTSAVVVAIVFKYFFKGDTSIVNYFIQQMGGSAIPWLTDPFWAKISLTLLSGWWSQGYHMLLYLAALQSIPQEVIEAAVVDGANRIQVFFKITVPLLKPIIIFTSIITVTAGLQRYAEPLLLTNGGPARSTQTMLMYLMGKAFGSYRLGYATAAGYVIAMITLVAALLQLKLQEDDK